MENLLSLLPLLACPVMMGLMMWMMRGNQNQTTGSHETPSSNLAAPTSPDDRLAVLRAQLADMEGQQQTIAAQIAQLQADDGPLEPIAHGETDAAGSRPVQAGPSA